MDDDDDDNWDDVYRPHSPAPQNRNQNHVAVAVAVAAPVSPPDIAHPTVNATTSAIPPSTPQPPSSAPDSAQHAESVDGALKTEATSVHVPMLNTDGLIARSKATEDAEFMAAAAAQKDSKDAEWQFDESDAESSSHSDTSSDSSDDSDSGSDEGYEMLDPATAAKILMSGEGDDDAEKGGGKSGADHQPRTANEVKEDVVPKPDVIITPETKLTFLGVVDKTVENMVLIKGHTPGEYQVLETGSVLCNEQRQVIGAVADTFGRVQEPLYSVAFTNQKEIAELGLAHGANVFYVDSHSTFVFTQPLRNLKGTDASNIHDEEVNEDEMEFSDDEKEAEYKRQKKLAKRGGTAAFSRSDFSQGKTFSSTPTNEYQPSYIRGNDAPLESYGGGGLSYDDDDADAAGAFYEPLKRPDNLDQLMGAPRPPPQQGFDRGRGRGRGDRGRGDRGRGRGDRGRGRGGFNQQRGRGGQYQPQQGSSQHAHPQQGSSQHAHPPQPSYSQPDTASPSAAPYQQYGQYHGAPSTYVANGQTYQYNPPQYPAPAASQPEYYGQQPSASTPLPPGMYPAFYRQQVQSSQQQQPHAGWQGQYNQAYAGAPASHQAQASGQQGPDIGAILQNLQKQHGQQ